MANDMITDAQLRSILDSVDLVPRARIQEGISQRPFSVQKITLDLGVAQLETQPYAINFPFKSCYVEAATDINTFVQMKVTTQDSLQSPFRLGQNDAPDFGSPVAKAFLHWQAQTGKSITIVFFTDATFRSGKLISQNSGGVSISDGTVVSATTRVTLVALTAAVIAPQDLTRKIATIQNNTGGDLYISGANTVTDAGATKGIAIPAGGLIYHRNTGALYGYSVGGGDVQILEEQ